MTTSNPPKLQDLAIQNLLHNEVSAIDSLQWLPRQLFPPLFKAAIARRCSQTLKAMVGTWPFSCLPLGALMAHRQPDLYILQVTLDGLDALLAQKIRPCRCKLQVLDLRKNNKITLEDLGYGIWARDCVRSSQEPEDTQHPRKKQKVECSRIEEQLLGPLQVMIELRVAQSGLDESLNLLIDRVEQSKGLLQLCCTKLSFETRLPQFELTDKILKLVRLDCVQELIVRGTWDRSTMASFVLYLGQMVNLRILLLFEVSVYFRYSQTQAQDQENLLVQFTSQFLRLHQLKKLYLEAVSFLKDNLGKVLRNLQTSLEALCITDCSISNVDLVCLSLCPNTSHLRSLNLSHVILSDLNMYFLKVLLEKTSDTLLFLDMYGCRLTDSQVICLLPALRHCTQLLRLRFSGSPVSMAVLEVLLRDMVPLCKFLFLEFPVPEECYLDNPPVLHEHNLDMYIDRIRFLMHEFGQYPTSITTDNDFDFGCDSIAVMFDN
ncbi:melanoma antigen preferentially expressed in tumors-like [Echinops telfairi]|uniref:Melanoma antigen preferentially expressed in tumors-like n=1 Tax=Echinops telfairi TaxID=9371 RepID=A0AC55D102_ECHTE|nr:melanoma antigen preferentially expressed in tumors-like [Echinops telfairi]